MAETTATARRILVAVDSSEESMSALSWCLENVTSKNSKEKDTLVLLYVKPPRTVYTALDGTGRSGEHPEGYLFSSDFPAAMDKYRNGVAYRVMQKAMMRLETRIEHGDPGDVICQMTRKLGADVLVMGSHGYGPIKSLCYFWLALVDSSTIGTPLASALADSVAFELSFSGALDETTDSEEVVTTQIYRLHPVCSLHYDHDYSSATSSPFTEKHSIERYHRDQWLYKNQVERISSCSVPPDSDSVRQDDIALQLPELKNMLRVLREKRESEGCGGGHCGPGKVFLVGTGPGDPELLTLKAVRVIQSADLLLYDRLVSEDVLDLVGADARLLYVGKTAGYHSRTQEEIHELLLSFAEAGATVVRLKGGDPLRWGGDGFSATTRIQVKVIPGITAASGIAAELGIPLTQRCVANSVFAELKDLAQQIMSAHLVSPTLIIIGKVVALSPLWPLSLKEASSLVEAKKTYFRLRNNHADGQGIKRLS
ncbi:Siroheme synthase [Morella rubra]|uniref:uroporphyrinogen-III C-methyltransferase n=1 Tax=Morella rubra TaxID=262757 RepID=A0A6A1WM06_9ROSI|nr:Siroheme synthase [Morella rubra]